MAFSLLYFFIIWATKSSAASCIQLSSASINKGTFFWCASLQTLSKRTTTLFHSAFSDSVSSTLEPTFSYKSNLPKPVGLKTANGIASRSLANSMVFNVIFKAASNCSSSSLPSTE